jgi:hypothetical protein
MKTEATIPLAIAAAAVIAVAILHDDVTQAVFVGRGEVEVPTVNVPRKLRQGNWLRRGTRADGSCCHASLISLLRWQGQYTLADRWRRTHSGGETSWTMAEHLDDAGIPYAWCQTGDEAFLEWAVRTRRGACIQYKDSPSSSCYHMVNVVHLTDKWVGLLDNNDVRRFKWMDRSSFMRNWKASMGWAFTPVFSPAAPLPPTSVRREKL